MIHGFLFVTIGKHDAHGKEFLDHASRINRMAGTKIRVYHEFHEELEYLQKTSSTTSGSEEEDG